LLYLLLFVLALFMLVILVGIYKFNFTDDDIYVENKDGQFVPIYSKDKE